VKDPLRHRDELYTSPIEEDHTADDNRDCMGHRKGSLPVLCQSRERQPTHNCHLQLLSSEQESLSVHLMTCDIG
jgi:hypothetical protein